MIQENLYCMNKQDDAIIIKLSSGCTVQLWRRNFYVSL